MSALDLRTLQRWVASVVAHPAAAPIALRSAGTREIVAPLTATDLLRCESNLAASARLDIYSGGYLARLAEALRSDYGAVASVLGEAEFKRAVAAYVARHPSRHPNLNQLGQALPQFLARRRSTPRRGFVAELAALECAISRAFDAPEFTPLAVDALQEVAAEQWPAVRLRTNPSLQLLATRAPVDRAYQAFKAGRRIDVPRAGKRASCRLAVYRRGDRVQHERLAPAAFAVLRALVDGQPLGRALARADGDPRVGAWFQSFAQNGLFVAMAVPSAVAALPAARPTRRRTPPHAQSPAAQ